MTDNFDAALWRQADALLNELLDLPIEQRACHVAALSVPAALRSLLETMLQATDRESPLDGDAFSRLHPLEPATEAPSLQGQTLGRYLLGDLIGRGGMSSVYRATRNDGAFDAPVALKLLSPALLGSDWQQRFVRETRMLAGLRHRGIAALLDAGLGDDGSPWLVTELVQGQSIDRYCQQHQLDTHARVQLLVQLCTAVAFVQRNLIVHRDIKCANVMVDEHGQVKLLDFGIARSLANHDGDAATATRVFTPDYAAPEQLHGGAITTATDVFSIGILMYRLLTGVLPFSNSASQRDERSQLTPPSREVASTPALTASERMRLAHQLRGDLDNIVVKALNVEPDARYASAQALLEDLQAWLEHRPVSARRPSLRYRLSLFLRRRTELAVVIALSVALVSAGIITTLWQARVAQHQAELASNVTRYLVDVFTAADPTVAGTEDPPASELLRRGSLEARSGLDSSPATAAELLRIIGSTQRLLGFLDDAEVSLVAALERVPQVETAPVTWARIQLELGELAHDNRDDAAAVELYTRGVKALENARIDQDLRGGMVATQAQLQIHAGQLENARDSIPALRRTAGDPSIDVNLRIKALRTIMMVQDAAGDVEELPGLLQQAVTLAGSVPEASPLELSMAHGELAFSLLDRGLYEQSLRQMERVMELTLEHLPEDHPRMQAIWSNLGHAAYYANQPETARDAFLKAITIHNARPDAANSAPGMEEFWLIGALWSGQRWLEFDRQVARVFAEMQLTPSNEAWIQVLQLLALQDRELWLDAAQRGSELLASESMQQKPRLAQDVLRALTAWSWWHAGEVTRAIQYSSEILPPTEAPPSWSTQLLSLTMVSVLDAMGDEQAASDWQAHLDQHGAVIPILQRLATRSPSR